MMGLGWTLRSCPGLLNVPGQVSPYSGTIKVHVGANTATNLDAGGVACIETGGFVSVGTTRIGNARRRTFSRVRIGSVAVFEVADLIREGDVVAVRRPRHRVCSLEVAYIGWNAYGMLVQVEAVGSNLTWANPLAMLAVIEPDLVGGQVIDDQPGIRPGYRANPRSGCRPSS